MTTATDTKLQAGTWNADAVHSQVGFEVSYMVGTFRGTFSPFEATLEVREDGTASLRGSTRAEGVHVQDESLTAHLQSPEFFDAERTPELAFASREIRVDGADLTVEGDLSIKGTSLPVTLTGSITGVGKDAYGNDRIGLTLWGTVDRSAFGLNWNAPLPNGEPALADEVTVTADLSFVRAS